MEPNRWRVVVGTALLAALVGTACSSSGSSGGGSSASTTTTVSLGPVKNAVGAPVKVGYIYAGQAQSIDNTNEIKLARATAKYVNEHLGGVAGRPLEIVECEDHLTPAGASDCANQMLADKVVAVLAGNPANSAPIVKLLEPAKVPFFIQTAAEASVVFSPDASVMANPIVILAAPIKLAKEDGVKKVALVTVDLPAAAQLPALGVPMFQKAGLELKTTAVPLGTPDVTPQIQAALSNGAQQFVVIGDISLCVNTLKALKTLGYGGKVMSNFNCLTDPSAKAIPGGFDGLLVLNTRVSDPTVPDVKILNAVAATYASGTPTDDRGQAVLGFVTTLGFVRAMKNLKPTEVTAAGVTAALQTMSPQPVPLLPGQTFQCNRTISTITPASCSNGAVIITIDKSGAPVKNDIFDSTPYLKT